MLGFIAQGYAQVCVANSGGVSRLWIGDAEDFNFTPGVTDAQTSGYSAVARRAGATFVGGGNLFEIVSLEDSLNVKVTQSRTEGSSQWAYDITGKLVKMQQSMSQFAEKLDAAAVCGQIIFVWQDNNGKIWVAGEKYVSAAAIVKFKIKQDGSVIDSGLSFTTFNGMNFAAKGNYFRPPYEYTAGIAALTAATMA